MKFNRIIAGITSLCIIGGAVPVMGTALPELTVYAEVDQNGNEYTKRTYEALTYWKYADHIEIADCDQAVTEVVVPEEIEGLTVTSIGDCAFYDCTTLNSIEIPDSVKSIGQRAFYNCTDLISVQIPNSVTNIEGGAFERCSSLVSIKIPDSVTNIGYWAF